MTRRGFLSGIATIVTSPRAVADAAVTAAVVGEARDQIAATDAKFVAAAKALFGDGSGDGAFHDLRPERRYSWNGVGIFPGEAMAYLLMEDLDAYGREGRLAERMDELEAHGDYLEEYACGALAKIPLTRRWLEEFRRRRASEAGNRAKDTEAAK